MFDAFQLHCIPGEYNHADYNSSLRQLLKVVDVNNGLKLGTRREEYGQKLSDMIIQEDIKRVSNSDWNATCSC